jgi:hypothetical protein
MDKSKTESTRIIVNGQVSYEPLKDLVFTGKIGYDKGYSTYDSYTVPRFQTSDFLNPTDANVASVLNENAEPLSVNMCLSLQEANSSLPNSSPLTSAR